MTETNIHDLPHYIDPSVGLAVKGIDLQQARESVLLNAETVQILYGPDYSPAKVKYAAGSRPKLEDIATQVRSPPPRKSAEAALQWVVDNIRHPFLSVPTAKDRAMTEEEIIDSGVGYCNEQTRVFVALCEVMEIPGRLCFLSHKNGKCGHVTAEIYLDGKWAWFDVTFNTRVELPDGKLATAWELSQVHRNLATDAYRAELERCEDLYIPEIESEPGWKTGERLTPDAGGDLIHTIGICNYIIDGVEIV